MTPTTDATAAQVRVTTPAREWGAIARLLRERHLRDGVPWDELAVVARSRAHVETIRRALAHAEVPVRSPATSGAPFATTRQPAGSCTWSRPDSAGPT